VEERVPTDKKPVHYYEIMITGGEGETLGPVI